MSAAVGTEPVLPPFSRSVLSPSSLLLTTSVRRRWAAAAAMDPFQEHHDENTRRFTPHGPSRFFETGEFGSWSPGNSNSNNSTHHHHHQQWYAAGSLHDFGFFEPATAGMAWTDSSDDVGGYYLSGTGNAQQVQVQAVLPLAGVDLSFPEPSYVGTGPHDIIVGSSSSEHHHHHPHHHHHHQTAVNHAEESVFSQPPHLGNQYHPFEFMTRHVDPHTGDLFTDPELDPPSSPSRAVNVTPLFDALTVPHPLPSPMLSQPTAMLTHDHHSNPSPLAVATRHPLVLSLDLSTSPSLQTPRPRDVSLAEWAQPYIPTVASASASADAPTAVSAFIDHHSVDPSELDDPAGFHPPALTPARLSVNGYGTPVRTRRTPRDREHALASAARALLVHRSQASEYSSTSTSHSAENSTVPSPPLLAKVLVAPEVDTLSAATAVSVHDGDGDGADDDGEEGGELSEAEEDVYQPSHSPSSDYSPSNYSGSASPPRGSSRIKIIKRRKMGSGEKKQLSAADALRMVRSVFSADDGTASEGGSSSATVSYGGGRTAAAAVVRPRRNQSIPIPVPVPHLTKKSRGRKVPHVSARPAPSPSAEEEESESDEHSRASSSRRGRGGGPVRGGGRQFVCEVCGKCFIRGEHLKRHIRSIHTHEKPFLCPHPGCGKSFSRQDNLGQHVRLHINSES